MARGLTRRFGGALAIEGMARISLGPVHGLDRELTAARIRNAIFGGILTAARIQVFSCQEWSRVV